jgi:chloramphenicol 3-O-phosphotransferase
MAITQAVAVHAGVVYEVEVDTTGCSAIACARRIAETVASARPASR